MWRHGCILDNDLFYLEDYLVLLTIYVHMFHTYTLFLFDSLCMVLMVLFLDSLFLILVQITRSFFFEKDLGSGDYSEDTGVFYSISY